MNAPRFHELTVKQVSPDAAGAVAITFAVPGELREAFAFAPGQFLTVRASVEGQDLRRSYSICCPRSRLEGSGELQIGIRPVDGGLFSNWVATQVKAGDRLRVMPPEGRFTIQRPRALHRVGFAAGSGITPILSIMASTMEESPDAKFTLIYGNRRMDSVMFNEALQDLKDKYPGRLTMIHILSRQAQEVDLLEGRIDGPKVRALIDALLPVGSMDEVFVCGPDGMVAATQAALLEAGVAANRIRTERFTTHLPPEALARGAAFTSPQAAKDKADAAGKRIALTVVLDGKPREIALGPDEHILDAALAAGLDLPYSCKGGVCCTCRAKVIEGSVVMDKNFTLEPWETDKGFVLSCQARATSDRVVISYDER